jgi:hypothetical protein
MHPCVFFHHLIICPHSDSVDWVRYPPRATRDLPPGAAPIMDARSVLFLTM